MPRSGTSSSRQRRHASPTPLSDSMTQSEPQIRAIRLSPDAALSNSNNSGSARAQPPTPHRLGRRGRSARSRATLSSASPMFSAPGAAAANAANNTAALSGSRASSNAASTGKIPSSPAPRLQGVGALYALAAEEKVVPPAPGPCACVLCARARHEWSFGSDGSGWGWGSGARQGVHAVPANCPVALALDTVCARTLADFVSVGTGVEALPLYKLHVRRTVYLLSAAGAAAARVFGRRDSVEPELARGLRLPTLRRSNSTRNIHLRQMASGRALFSDPDEPIWAHLGSRNDSWRPLSVQERMDVRAAMRSARIFLEKHHGPGANLAPDELAALYAEVALTASVPPMTSWSKAPRWQSRALSVAERNRMTPADSKAWANCMRDYLAFISHSTGIPIEVLRQLNAHCFDLAHLLAITSECERSRSLRARSSSVSADSLRERIATPSRRRSIVRTRTLSPIGSRSVTAQAGSARFRRIERWAPLSHTQRTLLRIEMAQVYRYICSFAVQDPCADYPDELAAIIAEVYISWPVPPGIDKSRHPRWSHRAVPDADWQSVGFRARQAFRNRSRKYVRFVCEKTGVLPSYARKLDADSFDRLHASAIFHDIDTCSALYTPREPVSATVEDPVAQAISAANGGHMWTSPVLTGSTATAMRHGSLNISGSDVRDISTMNAHADKAPSAASAGSDSAVDKEIAHQRGYIINSQSDTAHEDAPRPLSMSRRSRLQHEAREAQWYLDCAVHAADSFASNLRESVHLLNTGVQEQVDNQEQVTSIIDHAKSPTVSPVTKTPEDQTAASDVPTPQRPDRPEPEQLRQRPPARRCAESVSSGESLRDWLMRVESQEAQYSWECAACRGTGANPCRRDAPRWHRASLGPAAHNAMDERARRDWDDRADAYLSEISRLVGVDQQTLRAADAAKFERWHIAALRAFAADRADMPPLDFAPRGPNTCVEDERPVPHTRAFLARCLQVPLPSMDRVSEDECASLLSDVAFESQAPYGVDRQAYPPWHHRSVPPREWAALNDIQRRERRLHYRAQILAIARKFSIPPLVVTELDARTYRFAADAIENDPAVTTADQNDESWAEEAPMTTTTVANGAMPSDDEEGEEDHVVTGMDSELDDSYVTAPEPGAVEAHIAALTEAQSEADAQASSGSDADALLRPTAAVRQALSPVQGPSAREPLPLAQKREVRFEDAEEDEDSGKSQRIDDNTTRVEVLAEDSCDDLAPPVVNITRAQGATTEMYRRSLLQFARQMARDAHLNERELEHMSTKELANIVRNAVSSAFRPGAGPGLPTFDTPHDVVEDSSSLSGLARRHESGRPETI